MTNNDILKKLRIALKLRDEDIIRILQHVDFDITKGALNDLFRAEDHPSFVLAGDQILRNFLNGLIVEKRGDREHPKSDDSAPVYKRRTKETEAEKLERPLVQIVRQRFNDKNERPPKTKHRNRLERPRFDLKKNDDNTTIDKDFFLRKNEED